MTYEGCFTVLSCILERMAINDESKIMAEAIGETSVAFLGKENLHSLTVLFFANEERAEVWVTLEKSTVEYQLSAVAAFQEVRSCYEDEYEVELIFGEPTHAAAEIAMTKKMALVG